MHTVTDEELSAMFQQEDDERRNRRSAIERAGTSWEKQCELYADIIYHCVILRLIAEHFSWHIRTPKLPYKGGR